MASKMGPGGVGSQGRARTGRGAPSWGRSRAPVLTVHRGEGVCFAVHIHGETEEREQRGRRRRVASQTQLQDLRKKGRDGGGGERAPGCGGALGGRGAPRCAPCRDSSRACRSLQPQRPELPTVGARGWAVSRTAPGWQAGPGGPGVAWRARQLRPGLRLGGGDGSLSSPGTLSSSGGSRSSRGAGAARGRRAGSRAAPSAGELAKLAKK